MLCKLISIDEAMAKDLFRLDLSFDENLVFDFFFFLTINAERKFFSLKFRVV